VRLRIINTSSMSAFHIDLGKLEGHLVAVDGLPVQKVHGSTFPIAVAQRLDIELAIPKTAAAYRARSAGKASASKPALCFSLKGTCAAHFRQRGHGVAALTLDLERSLRAVKPLADRKANRTYTINLDGGDARLQWSSIMWPGTRMSALMVTEGERVELVLVQSNHDASSMHLHGHSFQVVAITATDSLAHARYRAGSSKKRPYHCFRRR